MRTLKTSNTMTNNIIEVMQYDIESLCGDNTNKPLSMFQTIEENGLEKFAKGPKKTSVYW